MGKTFKDKANHFSHHLKLDPDLPKVYGEKAKARYMRDEVPADVKELVEILEAKWAGCRYGNHRKMMAREKVQDRRTRLRDEGKIVEQLEKDM